MRAFVVLCLVAVAAAQYDYSPSSSAPVAVASEGDSAPISGESQLSPSIQPASEFNKEFYSYSAPEGEFDDAAASQQIGNSLKKNLRVVFIRGPENNGLENAALQLAKSASDDRTAIYVLNKQADVSDLANKLSQLQNNANSKPEVHFVKYRTNSDAENAQRTIQSQYDSLPGPSSNTNGGQADVLNFASRGPSHSAPSNAYVPPQASYLPPGRRF